MLLYWKIKIFKRPRWKTELTVRTWPRKFERVSSWRDFEVLDEEGGKVAKASSEWVLIDTKKQSISKITENMVEEYGLVKECIFEEEPSRKTKSTRKYEKNI